MKRITKEPWFGKRRIGWGWTPITWQGWIITLILILIILVDAKYLAQTPVLLIIVLVIATIGFIIIALLTGGKPGSELLDKENN